MKNKKVIILSIVIVVLLAGYTKGCAYLPITGTVVDAETGKPIEGAVVLVEWTIKKGIGDKHTESVKVAEVVTDKDGKFGLPGCYRLFLETPDLTIYKRGYVAWSSNYVFSKNERRTDFQWKSGAVFKLEQVRSSFSFDDHYYFITSAMRPESATDQKKLFFKAYDEWERAKAIKERDEKQRGDSGGRR